MELSIFLARFFGLYLLIVGFFYIFRKRFLQEATRDFFNNKGLVVYSGILSLIIGLLLVLSHSVWVWDWPVIITVFGYLSLAKGLIRLFFSDRVWASKMISGHGPTYIGIISLIFSLVLIYEGFLGNL